MKLAVISPPQCIDVLEQWQLGYHMALGQKLVSDMEYSALYRNESYYGRFIMVDNGAAEGEHIAFGEIVVAANKIGADEIAMPDVLRDADRTLVVTEKALRLVPRNKRMLIPQGATWEDWDRCLHALMLMRGSSLGIPKLLDEYPGGRERALDFIQTYGIHKEIDVHLLGANENPLEEIEALGKQFPWIRGIDTGAPIAYAQRHECIDSPNRRSLDWARPTNLEVADRNISMMLKACNKGR